MSCWMVPLHTQRRWVDELECEYDSTWEDEEEEEGEEDWNSNKEEKKSYLSLLKQAGNHRNLRAAQDMQKYRHYYTDNKEMRNLDFYLNKTCSQPDGMRIEEIHREWKGNYEKLERVHSYIQWLFPLQEPGMNYHAVELTPREIKKFCRSNEAKQRLVVSYELMLDFYGIQLINKDTGEVQRAENWEDRFDNLNENTHNNLRITRILKCLGELGFEHYQAPLVHFFLEETLIHRTLSRVKQSVLDYFLFAVRNKRKRQELVEFAFEHYKPQTAFVWCPRRIQKRFAQRLKKTMGITGDRDKSHLERKVNQQPSINEADGGLDVFSNCKIFSKNEESNAEAIQSKWCSDTTMTTSRSTHVALTNMEPEKKPEDQDIGPNKETAQNRDDENIPDHSSETLQKVKNTPAGEVPHCVQVLMSVPANDNDPSPNKDTKCHIAVVEKAKSDSSLGEEAGSHNTVEEERCKGFTSEEIRSQSVLSDVKMDSSIGEEAGNHSNRTEEVKIDIYKSEEVGSQSTLAEQTKRGSSIGEQVESHKATGEEVESLSAVSSTIREAEESYHNRTEGAFSTCEEGTGLSAAADNSRNSTLRAEEVECHSGQTGKASSDHSIDEEAQEAPDENEGSLQTDQENSVSQGGEEDESDKGEHESGLSSFVVRHVDFKIQGEQSRADNSLSFKETEHKGSDKLTCNKETQEMKEPKNIPNKCKSKKGKKKGKNKKRIA